MVTVRRSETTQAREGISPAARPWARTGMIDVEALAHWAYGKQMVDRFERTGLHAIEAQAAGYEVYGYSADGVGQLMAISNLGCRIDRGGVLVSDAVHPAAYGVAQAVRQLEFGHVVRAHALAGTRPSAWVEPRDKARAAVWVKPGKEAQVEYQGPGRKGGYCQVIITWDERRRTWGQGEYARWWDALGELTWRLSSYALGFMVTGPGAPEAPWLASKSNGGRPISIDESAEVGGAPTPPRGSSRGSRG